MDRETFLDLTKNFKNIIFDFGGILVNIDYKKTLNELSIISNRSVEELYSQHEQIDLFSNLETGKIGRDEFFDGLRTLLDTDSDNGVLENAWNAMLGQVPKMRVEFLKEFKKTKNLYMLSNINEIHEEKLKEHQELYSLFDKVYFSHHINLRKPNIDIFEYVLNDSGLIINETIFIDDSLQHIEAAKSLGLATIHLSPSNSFLIDLV